MNVQVSSLRLAGPLALIMAEVTALVDYEVRAPSVLGTAALSVAHWAVLHQLQNGLLINNVLQSWFLYGWCSACLRCIYLNACASDLARQSVHYCSGVLLNVTVLCTGGWAEEGTGSSSSKPKDGTAVSFNGFTVT